MNITLGLKWIGSIVHFNYQRRQSSSGRHARYGGTIFEISHGNNKSITYVVMCNWRQRWARGRDCGSVAGAWLPSRHAHGPLPSWWRIGNAHTSRHAQPHRHILVLHVSTGWNKCANNILICYDTCVLNYQMFLTKKDTRCLRMKFSLIQITIS